MKITFLGDLTCDKRMLQAAQQPDGSFDFRRSLRHVPGTLKDSDAVVGNLETVFGGPELGYGRWMLAYNSPDALLDALQEMGVTVMTTANNHTLDQEKRGLMRTLDQLDARGIPHTGAFRKADEQRFLVLPVGGIRVGLVAYADVLNGTTAGVQQTYENTQLVNHLHPYYKRSRREDLLAFAALVLPVWKLWKLWAKKNQAKGIKVVRAHVDNEPLTEGENVKLREAIGVLEAARKESDYVVAAIHTGGQFNGEPGVHSVGIYEQLKPHADAIMGNHAHVAQRIETYGEHGVLAYAIGGLNMSCGAMYVTHDDHPEFSLGVHLYLERGEDGKVRPEKATFTLYYNEEDENGYLTVYPVDTEGGKGDNEAMRTVFRRVAGYDFPGFQKEYEIRPRSD